MAADLGSFLASSHSAYWNVNQPNDVNADGFVAASDVLLTVFHTDAGDALVSGYDSSAVDVTSLLNAHLNETLRLRFAEVDNVFIFQFGVDNVTLDVGTSQAVPEPASWALIGIAGLGLAWWQRRAGSRLT